MTRNECYIYLQKIGFLEMPRGPLEQENKPLDTMYRDGIKQNTTEYSIFREVSPQNWAFDTEVWANNRRSS